MLGIKSLSAFHNKIYRISHAISSSSLTAVVNDVAKNFLIAMHSYGKRQHLINLTCHFLHAIFIHIYYNFPSHTYMNVSTRVLCDFLSRNSWFFCGRKENFHNFQNPGYKCRKFFYFIFSYFHLNKNNFSHQNFREKKIKMWYDDVNFSIYFVRIKLWNYFFSNRFAWYEINFLLPHNL